MQLTRIGNSFFFLKIMHIIMTAPSQKGSSSKSLLKIFDWQLEELLKY